VTSPLILSLKGGDGVLPSARKTRYRAVDHAAPVVDADRKDRAHKSCLLDQNSARNHTKHHSSHAPCKGRFSLSGPEEAINSFS
jgi:hypothetical protein